MKRLNNDFTDFSTQTRKEKKLKAFKKALRIIGKIILILTKLVILLVVVPFLAIVTFGSAVVADTVDFCLSWSEDSSY
ncbi:MAG: hypothetical protein LUD29_05655 [Clostridia bacterium]|nr:hypothetical protein [Clostridia bacterium]